MHPVIVAVVLGAIVASATLHRPVPRATTVPSTESFGQFNSTIFQYTAADHARQAAWSEAPFESINGTLYVSFLQAFVALVDMPGVGNTALYAVIPAANPDAEGNVARGVELAALLQLPTGSGACRLLPPPNSAIAASGNLTIVCQGHGASSTLRQLTVALPSTIAGGAVLLSNAIIPPLAGGNGVLLDATWISGGDDGFLLATSSGLVHVMPGSSISTVPLLNTTGSPAIDLHVARIFCLDDEAYTAVGGAAGAAFFGARCFAVTRTTYCAVNMCPADNVHLLGPHMSYIHYIRTPGVIDAWPQAMAFDPVERAIQFANEAAVNVLYANGTLDRVGGIFGGLPTGGLTSAASTRAGTWFGSDGQGAMLRHPTDGSWKYFFGPRWLPGTAATPGPAMHVTSIAACSTTGTALVATRTGFAVIQRIVWTASAKAAYLGRFDQLFWRTNFSQATASLKTWGVPASSLVAEDYTANQGLWTSIYLAGQIFRFASTGSAEAKANCWRAFSGMERLCQVSGIKGLCARDAAPHQVAGWLPSPVFPGWYFEGNPSSDEVTGHLHVYPLMHDLVAETPEERQRVVALIRDITSNIVDGGLVLHRVDGQPTKWGHWDPAALNDDPFWYDGRGLNSLQILAILSAGYRLTQNETYATVFTELVQQHGYATNVVNLKITQPSDVNYSDDELTFLNYLQFVWSGRPTPGLPSNKLYEMAITEVRASVGRTWNYVHRERPDLWSVVYLFAFTNVTAGGVPASSAPTAPRASAAVSDLQFCLQTWPASVVWWPVNNSARKDVQFSPYPDRFGRLHALLVTLLPYDENGLLIWNSNPFSSAAGNGAEIKNPAFFSYPFWMARWMGVL